MTRRRLQEDPHADYFDLPGQNPKYISFGNNFNHTTDSFTWEFWYRSRDPQGKLFRKYSGGAKAGIQVILVGGKLQFYLSYDNAGAEAIVMDMTTDIVISDGLWHHIALVASRGAAGHGYVYVDGAQHATDVDRAPAGSITNAESLTWNLTYGNAPQNAAAWIHDLKHYSRALSAAEVAAAYAGTAPTPGPVAHWTMKDAGNSLPDDVGCVRPVVGSVNGTIAAALLGARKSAVRRRRKGTAPVLTALVVSDLHVGDAGALIANLTKACAVAKRISAVDMIIATGDMAADTAGTGDAAGQRAKIALVDAELAASGLAANRIWWLYGNHDGDHIGRTGAGSWAATTAYDVTPMTAATVNGVRVIPLTIDYPVISTTLADDLDFGEEVAALDSTAGFELDSEGGVGTAIVDNEVIKFTSIVGNELRGLSRGQQGTAEDMHALGQDITQGSFAIGAEQRAWLAAELRANVDKPAVVVCHARLDQTYPGAKLDGTPWYTGASGMATVFAQDAYWVRRALQAGREHIACVLTAHEHGQHVGQVEGIWHVNHPSCKTSTVFSILRVYADCSFELSGYGLALSTGYRRGDP